MPFPGKFDKTLSTENRAQLTLRSHHDARIFKSCTRVSPFPYLIESFIQNLLRASVKLDHRLGVHQQHIPVTQYRISRGSTIAPIFQERLIDILFKQESVVCRMFGTSLRIGVTHLYSI